eukprot:2463728-Amphidinium_carterae.1
MAELLAGLATLRFGPQCGKVGWSCGIGVPPWWLFGWFCDSPPVSSEHGDVEDWEEGQPLVGMRGAMATDSGQDDLPDFDGSADIKEEPHEVVAGREPETADGAVGM